MRIVSLLLLSLSLIGCANINNSPPRFDDPRLRNYLAHLLTEHEIFVQDLSRFRDRPITPLCDLNTEDSWALSGAQPSSPHIRNINAYSIMVEGECRDGKAVAPYIAATRYHHIASPDTSYSQSKDRLGWRKEMPGQGALAGSTTTLRETNETSEFLGSSSITRRYDHSIRSASLIFDLAIIPQSAEKPTYRVRVRQYRSPQHSEVWYYTGKKLYRHYTEVNGNYHGIRTTFPIYGKSVRDCYRHGEKAPLQSCGVRVAEKSDDNFGAALLGGLAAAAVGHGHGMSEAAAVDLGTSMASDIQNNTVNAQNLDANRFQTSNQGRVTAEVYAKPLSNNVTNSTSYAAPLAQTNSTASQHEPTTHKPGSEPPPPQSLTSCKTTYPRDAVCARGNSSAWYGSHGREVAVSQAREHAKAQIYKACRSKGKYTTPSWGDSAWSEGSPECREAYGYRTDGSPLLWCELDVWAKCIPTNH